MARQFGLALAPWDAICSGRLLTEKQLEARVQSGEKMRRGGNEQTELERKYSKVLEEIGNEHGVDSVTAVALACKSPGFGQRRFLARVRLTCFGLPCRCNGKSMRCGSPHCCTGVSS